MDRLRLFISTTVTSMLVLAGLVAISQPAAAAEERYPAPASGYWDVNGRGWGHGIGMSQWGALGAAEQGQSYTQILDFYYPGTTRNTVPNSNIRVALSQDDYTPTDTVTLGVPTGQRMTIKDAAGNAIVSGVAGRFTVTRDSDGFTIERRDRIDVNEADADRGVRATYESASSEIEFSTGDGVAVFPVQRETDGTWYRGTLRLVGSAGVAGAFDVVNHLRLEDYLRGVVPRESPSAWPAEALKAQAVAARSYALTEKKAAHFDTCDTTQCQVYGGRAEVVADGVAFGVRSNEAASTDAAISATAGQVRWYAGKVAFTQFSANNGGFSRQGRAYGAEVPYLPAKADPWTGTGTGDARTRWTDRLAVSTVAQQCPDDGSLRTMVITRDGNGELGGRIVQARLECSTGNVTLSRPAFGMYSSWWRPVEPPYGFFLNDSWTATANTVFQYGKPDDEVYIGDWDGDGIDTIAIRRGAEFHVRNSNSGGAADRVFVYGKPGDVVLVGDWNGDGVDTLAVRRGPEYHIKNSVAPGRADQVVVYGRSGDAVVVGDWDGNGSDTLAVRRGMVYHIKNSISAGNADQVVPYGKAADVVMVGDWNGDSRDTLAVRRGREYHIKNSMSGGKADLVLAYGRPGDKVIVGDWNGDGTDTLGVHRTP
ncbi:SpoIID/LytB domain-containing protein [Georgenia subflava]|uniref:SpoIID/LytB domain-containing protein n=1 Tax=Georgenia subflava TaxID=1622177 RepID=A0A6N7EKV9_9MICO|nr:SpoIID/LytB domain-containing protein [Georgenia subflava]MPV38071.1 SpoIID/LytB domain-containing protein [Georgenia subflava]